MNMYIYGSHDASFSIEKNGEIYVYEIERFNNKRHSAITDRYKQLDYLSLEELENILNFIKLDLNIGKITKCYYNQIFEREFTYIKKYFDVDEFICYDHHLAHAAGAFYQSKFEESYIISYDGGGNNSDETISYFTVWKGSKENLVKLHDIKLNLGTPYLLVGDLISDIRKKPNSLSLSNSGKLMGYASYGDVQHQLVTTFRKFYNTTNFDVFNEVGLNLTKDCLSGKVAQNFSATSQFVFEQIFFEIFNTLNIPDGSNVCVTGGCALNILVNQKLINMGYNVYVPPNPNDCGLSLGALLSITKKKCNNLQYRGFEILDKNSHKYTNTIVNNFDIASLLFKENRILGYIEGRSECGPRALGNRSILCYPDQTGLKNKLNEKIKFREWFRPFGAIIRLEDLHYFFENGVESPYMSFCPTLKPQYRFDAITHIDNTCRVQTVTKEQHSNIYEILTMIQTMGGMPILLNTSFNIKGKPILTKLSDAIECLEKSELDGFVYQNKLYQL